MSASDAEGAAPHDDTEQQRIAEARVKTGDFIARLMMAYAGFAAFCVFALLSPDRLMIEAQASLNMPLAGTVSFLAFMAVAPVVLIGMRVYLEVYVQHWRQLAAELDPETEPKTLSPLKHPLLRRFSDLVLYFLLTAMLVLFTWKAAAKDVWGEVFLLLTVVCVAAQAYQFFRGHRSHRTARLVAFSGTLFVFVLIGALYKWELPHRGLTLVREDLKGAYLAGKDLRHAVLSQANLTGADLTVAELTGANLSFANLTGADLTRARLTDADLTRANLTRAKLTVANLTDADLTDADFRDADLSFATLSGAKLKVANLRGAELTGANLRGADLGGAELTGANLTFVELTGANLTGANLSGANNLTQKKLDTACVIEGGRPPALPEGLNPPQRYCVPRIL